MRTEMCNIGSVGLASRSGRIISWCTACDLPRLQSASITIVACRRHRLAGLPRSEAEDDDGAILGRQRMADQVAHGHVCVHDDVAHGVEDGDIRSGDGQAPRHDALSCVDRRLHVGVHVEWLVRLRLSTTRLRGTRGRRVSMVREVHKEECGGESDGDPAHAVPRRGPCTAAAWCDWFGRARVEGEDTGVPGMLGEVCGTAWDGGDECLLWVNACCGLT
jgi:hypothetical protein